MDGGGGVGVRPPPRFNSSPYGSGPPGPKPYGGGGGRGGGGYGGGGFRPQGGFDRQDRLAGLAYDGKRIRNKSVLRKTVDFNSGCINYAKNRLWFRDSRDEPAVQADELYVHNVVPPPAMLDSPMNCVTTRFVRNATNKIRCPIFCVCWTPEGRRLITGASSGEFTLWNGLTFNFETILQAHDTSIRCMNWSHNDQWLLTADHAGFVKYWQTNMNNVKVYQAHKEPIRGIRWAAITVATGQQSNNAPVLS